LRIERRLYPLDWQPVKDKIVAAISANRAEFVRMGDALVPLDEALAQVALDLSGRGYAVINVSWSGPRIGELPGDLVEHFLQSLAHEGRFNLHARVLAGVNDHHKAECLMKALGRALCAHSLDQARAMGYRAMQYNLVVSTNEGAVRLWKRHGFEVIGTLPKAFRHAKLGFVDALVMYKSLEA
jgi:GNAT superfamily N-acetyltransferase